MIDQMFDMRNAKVGDQFVKLLTSGYTSRISSAYDYVVIRAGTRDIVCHARRGGGFVTNLGNGTPKEFRFKRDDPWATAYCLGHSEVVKARAQIDDDNRRSKAILFLRGSITETYDDEFMTAVEEFQKRIKDKQQS